MSAAAADQRIPTAAEVGIPRQRPIIEFNTAQTDISPGIKYVPRHQQMYVKRPLAQSNTAENRTADDADIIDKLGSLPIIAHLMWDTPYANPIATRFPQPPQINGDSRDEKLQIQAWPRSTSNISPSCPNPTME